MSKADASKDAKGGDAAGESTAKAPAARTRSKAKGSGTFATLRIGAVFFLGSIRFDNGVPKAVTPEQKAKLETKVVSETVQRGDKKTSQETARFEFTETAEAATGEE